jgi:hypothetical protein
MKFKVVLTMFGAAALLGIATGALADGNLVSMPAMPEPSGWMMILAGIGLIGFMVNRRGGNDGR